MKVLITGAAGFIGTHLTAELNGSGHEVTGFDVTAGPGIIQGSCLFDSFADLVQRRKPDVVIHLAAKVGRLFGEDNIRNTISENVYMTAHVAQTCAAHGARLMYASTSEVYGDRGNHLCAEDEPFQGVPHNAYGLSKRQGEEFARLYCPSGLTIMRFSMPYGPGLPAGRGRAALINFLHNALHHQQIVVHRKSERSWCWIGDTVRAVRLLLERSEGGAYNIGRDDNAESMLSVAEQACRMVHAPLSLIELVDPPERQTVVKRLAMNKIRALGWEPRVDLEEGMRRCLDWVTMQYPKAA
jgi:nucleoside-diphosphate-sugar epimerase